VSCRLEPVSEVMAGPLSMLHRACFPEDPWSSMVITEMMRVAGCFGRLAWEDEMPSGFVLALDLRTECEILSLGVLSERRREGIGSALLDSVCSEGRTRGAGHIVLEVAVDNSEALALYSARGFVPIGCRPNYYRRASRCIDALVLRLTFTGVTIKP
jgi:[ribosomal protein S18]-alanine N-acetyltransferase